MAFDLRRLEEISQNASRAERGLMIDGWSIGLSPGLAKRSRCVNPFYPSARSFEQNLAAAKRAFATAGLPCVFRLTPFVSDQTLDTRLQDMGYTRFDSTLVQALSLQDVDVSAAASTSADQCLIAPHHDLAEAAQWTGAMRGDSSTEIAALAMRWQLNASQTQPLFAHLRSGARVARALGVIEDGHLGIFDVGTVADYRGLGYATALLRRLLIDAKAAGVHTAYLQVTPENTSRHIYERLGFRTVYEYWYRAAPP